MPLTAIPIRTKYWRPGDDFLEIIVSSVSNLCQDGDFIVVSEKAISVAIGRVVDESRADPGLTAMALARVWMRLVWGYFLGPLCHFSSKTLHRLRSYPIPEGEAHKEIALRYAGLSQSLLHYSEGGIDVSNLPFAFAALPPSNAEEIGAIVLQRVKEVCGKHIVVLIVDTDKTYSIWGTHITPRPSAISGIESRGILALVIGRTFRFTAQATPVAVCGREVDVEDALAIADVADQARGFGAGRTAWDMAERFHVAFNEVTWEMLDRVEHYPIVLVRKLE